MYRLILLSRRLDDKEIQLKRQNRTFFQISGAGHEAVLVGAAIAVLPSALMAWAVFRFRKTVAPRDYTRAIYRGELGKFLLTIVLFALVFAEGGAIRVAVLFGVFLAAIVVQWLLSARHLLSD